MIRLSICICLLFSKGELLLDSGNAVLCELHLMCPAVWLVDREADQLPECFQSDEQCLVLLMLVQLAPCCVVLQNSNAPSFCVGFGS